MSVVNTAIALTSCCSNSLSVVFLSFEFTNCHVQTFYYSPPSKFLELDVLWRLTIMRIQSSSFHIPVVLSLLLLHFNVINGIILNSSTSPTAQTLNGTYQGRHLSEFDQDLFLGVPFASAPRLDNPLSLNTTWLGKRDASEYGPTCYGFGSNTLLNLTLSEECLNLNIIRPSGTKADEKLPVLLWIYGGVFGKEPVQIPCGICLTL